MEIVIFLLVIVFSLITGSKKNKGKNAAQNPKAPAAAPKKGTAQAVQAAQGEADLNKARERARRRLAAAKLQMQQQMQGQPARPTVKAPAPQGMSAADDEGCVGGSMEHDHAEGESREEHGRHMAAMQAREAAEAAAQAARPAVDAAQLRRAVVMAEILDRPVSLRARRRAG